MSLRKRMFIRTWIFVLTLSAMATVLRGQSQQNPYYFEGNDVVFVFDVRTYTEAYLKAGEKIDFSDLRIHEVAISGSFNNWNQKGWRMQKKSEFIYELRKPVIEFNDAFPVEFKYIINGKYIASPGTGQNSRQFTDDFLEEVYKVDLSILKENPRGNVLFKLEGHLNASKVILAGSFNGWDERALKMTKGADGWYLRADLPPGKYEYKFIADGAWLHDPKARENVVNEHGTLNSVLYVTKPYTFTLRGFSQAKNVILSGSFVDWHERKLRMTYSDGAWTITIPLAGGKHLYKYIIDGQWHTDPSNPVVEDDGSGNLNSVLFAH